MHQTTAEYAHDHTPASASCVCGWTYTGGGYYACLGAAQTHRLDALERGETVTYPPINAAPSAELAFMR